MFTEATWDSLPMIFRQVLISNIDADTFLTPGRQYTYHVRARNNVGAIDSTSASAVVPDCTAPNHPPEYFALGLIRETSPTTAYISWFPAYDQDVGDHVHYEVWMGLYPNPTVWQKKASVDAPTREATVTGLIPNTFYDVRIIARDDHGGSVTNSELGNFYELCTPPNHPPSISITSPQTGSRFGIPASIVIAVNAGDGDGTVRKVEFFADNRKIGEINSPSLQFTWYNAPAHTYSLTALATDDLGATAVSSDVQIEVNYPPAAFSLQSDEARCSAGIPAISNNWTAPVGMNYPTGAAYYVIYRNGIAYRTNDIASLTFDNTADVVPGQAYFYFVRAFNPFGYRNSNTNTVAVPQDVCCEAEVSLSDRFPGPSGSLGSLRIETDSACPWSVVKDGDWITIDSPTNGNGSTTLSYTVTANPNCIPRTATFTVRNRQISLTQSAGLGYASLSHSSTNFGSIGGSGSILLSAGLGCSWTATNDANWIGITSGSNGIGSNTISFFVAANVDCLQRTGTIAVAGLTFTVTQEAGIGSYTLIPSGGTVHPAGNSTGTVEVVVAGQHCGWTATKDVPWIAFTSSTDGVGSGMITYAVFPNANCEPRTGSVRIAGQEFIITQSGTGTYALFPANGRTHADGASTGTVQIVTGSQCNWAATTDAQWISLLSAASGTGSSNLSYAVARTPTVFRGPVR